jgi:hypothetical protein
MNKRETKTTKASVPITMFNKMTKNLAKFVSDTNGENLRRLNFFKEQFNK